MELGAYNRNRSPSRNVTSISPTSSSHARVNGFGKYGTFNNLGSFPTSPGQLTSNYTTPQHQYHASQNSSQLQLQKQRRSSPLFTAVPPHMSFGHPKTQTVCERIPLTCNQGIDFNTPNARTSSASRCSPTSRSRSVSPHQMPLSAAEQNWLQWRTKRSPIGSPASQVEHCPSPSNQPHPSMACTQPRTSIPCGRHSNCSKALPVAEDTEAIAQQAARQLHRHFTLPVSRSAVGDGLIQSLPLPTHKSNPCKYYETLLCLHHQPYCVDDTDACYAHQQIQNHAPDGASSWNACRTMSVREASITAHCIHIPWYECYCLFHVFPQQ
jgi:hypothetical protein